LNTLDPSILPPQPVRISEVAEHAGRTVQLQGWLYNRRHSGKLYFLLVRDGSGILQCVVAKDQVSEATFAACGEMTQESAIRVTGVVRPDPRAASGHELTATEVEILSLAQEFPISKKDHGVEFLMDQRHLWLRSARQHALLLIRSEVVRACRELLDQRGFVLVDTPMFTPAACEGTSTLFEVPYFDQKAYLTQSGQLYNEATAMAFGRVYCFGPVFRAEKSKTRRHLTEFWMLEPEMAFAGIEEVMQVAEELVVGVVERVLDRRREELKRLERDTAPLERVRSPFPRLHYNDAAARLQARGNAFEWGGDFGAPDEEALAEEYDRPFFVHHFPASCKAFYMQPDPVDSRLSLSADMLAPEGYGEIVGGGQRVDDLALLERRIAEHNLPRAAFEWYLDLRRYGSVPHAGFGLGIERTVGWIAGIHHIRETIPFPRTIVRLTP
jgi:asparaginyl-tRNA synthetase